MTAKKAFGLYRSGFPATRGERNEVCTFACPLPEKPMKVSVDLKNEKNTHFCRDSREYVDLEVNKKVYFQ